MNLYEDKEGGIIVLKKLTWVGPIRAVKVTRNREKKTVYNFMMKVGFHAFYSLDYEEHGDAENDHNFILKVLAELS